MADFLKEIVNQNKINETNELLNHAESIIGDNIITQVNNLTTELDTLMDMMHKKINKDEYEISDKELEKLIIRLPILIYELNNTLMKAGIREDLAKIIKQTNYNSSYIMQEGTIADKKANAELDIKEEILLETTWKRSVKIINQKMDIANELLGSCKKILSRRIETLNLIKRSPI